jgi:hypothetical protein
MLLDDCMDSWIYEIGPLIHAKIKGDLLASIQFFSKC